jgi:hypothetical protein
MPGAFSFVAWKYYAVLNQLKNKRATARTNCDLAQLQLESQNPHLLAPTPAGLLSRK